MIHLIISRVLDFLILGVIIIVIITTILPETSNFMTSAILIIVAIINIILLYCKFKGEEAPNVMGLQFFNIVSR